jgi:hypothetical protein
MSSLFGFAPLSRIATTFGKLATGAFALTNVAGCVVTLRDDDPPSQTSYYAPTPTAPRPTTPVVVLLDTDKTMNATGGDGVGVFVEYKAGGKWQISWTCDTRLTGDSCSFTHTITGTTFTNPVFEGQSFEGSDTRLVSRTTVTQGVSKLTFSAPENAAITIQTTLAGDTSSDGRYFFFVQDGKVNGGFAGVLSNPLTFQPK